MHGYIVDETYRIDEGKAYVYLFGRLENGESFCAINHFRPYFCIREKDVKKAKGLPVQVPFEIGKTDWRTMQEEPAVKIIYDIPKDTLGIRRLFQDNGIPCFEADIRFTQRFLMDSGIKRSIDIEGEYEMGGCVSRVYREPELSPADHYPSLRMLSFDIETSPDAKRLYSVSLVCRDPGNERKEVFIVKDDGEFENARVFPDEKSLLEAFRQAVFDIDPDIITGWNTIDFDLAVLREKFRQHGVPFRMARMDWDCSLRIENSFLRESTADFPGRQVLDGIQMLKLNFISLDNYKLATAAEELLGDKKLITGENKGEDIENAYLNDPQTLVDYNLKDSELVLDILEKTNAVDIMLNRSLLTGMSLERVRGSIASFDSLYLRELRGRKYVAPTGNYVETEEGIVGGYVKQSKPGIYEYIIVCDFKSLYPSIMRTFNIDPLAYELGRNAPDPQEKDKWITSPNGIVFSAEEAILPELLQRLWDARDAAKKRSDPYASFAIKILMNSFFGVLAAPACRFFSLDVGNAITTFARHFIQLTIEHVEKMGYAVIYGDTDSVFVDAGCKSYEEAERVSRRISSDINKTYDAYVRSEYRRESYIELEPDKIFIHFIMPRVRGSEKGAKKRYAGIIRKNGKEELAVTGLEIVRRDWTELSKTFQTRLLQMVFDKKDPQQFIREFVQDVKSGKYDTQLVYRKAVRKGLDTYTKTTPPHVKAARLLEEHGQKLTSSIVEYVMTAEGPYPKDLMDGQGSPSIDYDHYIEKQLEPIADAILVFYDTKFGDVLKGSSQTTLGGF